MDSDSVMGSCIDVAAAVDLGAVLLILSMIVIAFEWSDDDVEAHCVSAAGSCDHAAKNGPGSATSGSLGGTDLVSAVASVRDVSGVDWAYGALSFSAYLLDYLCVDVPDSVCCIGSVPCIAETVETAEVPD